MYSHARVPLVLTPAMQYAVPAVFNPYQKELLVDVRTVVGSVPSVVTPPAVLALPVG